MSKVLGWHSRGDYERRPRVQLSGEQMVGQPPNVAVGFGALFLVRAFGKLRTFINGIAVGVMKPDFLKYLALVGLLAALIVFALAMAFPIRPPAW